MKPLPLPVRVAAGLAVTAVDRARHLPEKLAGLPVTMVSQALQLSMRVQQQVTELAIKGDDALSTLRPPEESPAWATFDEDEPDQGSVRRSAFDAAEADGDLDAADGNLDAADGALDADLDTGLGAGSAGGPDVEQGVVSADGASVTGDPWAAEERAMLHELDNTAPAEAATDATVAPTALPGYSNLTLAQVRARMRRLSIDELTELVDYERAHADRPSFVGMLNRRIATLRDQR